MAELCQMKYCSIIVEQDVINILDILYEQYKERMDLSHTEYESCIGLLNNMIYNHNKLFRNTYYDYKCEIEKFLFNINIPLQHEFDIFYYISKDAAPFNKWYVMPHIYHQVGGNYGTEKDFQEDIEYGLTIEYSHGLYGDTNLSKILNRINTTDLKCISFFKDNNFHSIADSFAWRIFK